MSRFYKKYVIDGPAVNDMIKDLELTMDSMKRDGSPARKKAVALAMGFLTKDGMNADEKTIVNREPRWVHGHVPHVVHDTKFMP